MGKWGNEVKGDEGERSGEYGSDFERLYGRDLKRSDHAPKRERLN